MYQITDDVAEGDRLSFAGDALVVCARVMVMVFNATSNNISVKSWRSVLLVEETAVPEENHRPAGSHRQTLSHNVVSRTPRLSGIRTICVV